MTKKEIKKYIKDDMPEGWYKAFGKEFTRELLNELEKADCFNDFEIVQIKEKYGGLRIYVGGAPKSVHQLIDKYEELSYSYCQICGKPGKVYDNGWIMVLCPYHAEKLNYREEE